MTKADDADREPLAARSVAPPRPTRRPSRFLAIVRGMFALIFLLGVLLAGAGALVGWNLYQRYAADLPTLDGLRTYAPPMMSRVFGGDDRLMAELATERRIFVPSAAIPEPVKQAFIAAEDQNFYTHKGVDPLAIARAAFTDLQRIGVSRRPVGASTITQQVARNMLLTSNALSFDRKAKEALLAIRIEKTLGKDRILELYLNEIYLGQGTYGIAAAAQTYFNKPLDQLTTAEAAMLAALPKSPTNYNPFRFPSAALTRRNWVIDRMTETHAITSTQAQAARAEALVPAAYRRPDVVTGSEWFAEEVRRQLMDRFGQDQTTEGGLLVHTSLSSELQLKADTALRTGLMAYDRSHGGWRGPIAHSAIPMEATDDWPDALAKVSPPAGMLPEWRLAIVLSSGAAQARLGYLPPAGNDGPSAARILPVYLSDIGWARPVRGNGDLGAAPRRVSDVLKPGDVVMVDLQAGVSRSRPDRLLLRQIPAVSGALVALDPHSGRVLAMSGGWSAAASQFNRATQAQRQPGSSFKPFVYLTAMQQGISPSARFLDAPFVQGDWRPNNYEMNFGGPTPLHVALEQSLNLVTVRVAQRTGMDAVAKTAIAYHLVDNMPRVLPAALGAVETTVLREAGAYASIARSGHVVVPSLIDSVQDRDGRIVWRPPGLTLGAGDPEQPPILADARIPFADPASSFQVLMMMRGVVLNGTGVDVVRGLDRPIAGKTGTSQDFNDAWFAGFTPDLVTVVWVGFDTPRSLGDKQTGAVVAGPIWHDFMQAALRDRPFLDFRVPEEVGLYRWGCGPHECVDAFKAGQEPGAAGVGGGGVETSSVGNVQMLDADPGEPGSSAVPPANRGSGTGVDSGVGGLY